MSTLAEVVRVIDGEGALQNCIFGLERCDRTPVADLATKDIPSIHPPIASVQCPSPAVLEWISASRREMNVRFDSPGSGSIVSDLLALYGEHLTGMSLLSYH
ncbi:hypothetical protein J7M22_06320 [Candidatus Poribacteria bacterium]|nr:hypothetical protein [Candidatus Poribacteria bacterium]